MNRAVMENTVVECWDEADLEQVVRLRQREGAPGFCNEGHAANIGNRLEAEGRVGFVYVSSDGFLEWDFEDAISEQAIIFDVDGYEDAIDMQEAIKFDPYAIALARDKAIVQCDSNEDRIKLKELIPSTNLKYRPKYIRCCNLNGSYEHAYGHSHTCSSYKFHGGTLYTLMEFMARVQGFQNKIDDKDDLGWAATPTPKKKKKVAKKKTANPWGYVTDKFTIPKVEKKTVTSYDSGLRLGSIKL